jgi:uncharacterized tellurite resistance protein B-like protein
MQRGIHGYNILTLLSLVDGKIDPKEDLVIRNWLIQQFVFTKNFDEQTEDFTKLKKADYEPFLQKEMDAFYKISNADERNNLIQFAMNVIKADGKIVKGENKYFDQLFNSWNEGE